MQRSGCLTALMVIVGTILLLPGLCAAIITFGSLSSGSFESGIGQLVLIGLLLGAAGVVLIREAIRPRR